MTMRDSVDKIVDSYFAAVADVPFDYKGRHYEVRVLTVSPLLLRGTSCPSGCGGCCARFSLDYLPSETHPYKLAPRAVLFNGRKRLIYSDPQTSLDSHHCGNLRMSDGRCGIHGAHPFSCDFELIRFMHSHSKASARLVSKLYGRGHAMLRVDGERGAMCSMTPATQETRKDVIRKLHRLAQWCDYFGLSHRVNKIITWAEGDCERPLVLGDPASTLPFKD